MANKRYSNFHRARKYYRKFHRALRGTGVDVTVAIRKHTLYFKYATYAVLDDEHEMVIINSRVALHRA